MFFRRSSFIDNGPRASSSWSELPRRLSRRFSTLEGYHQIGQMYVAGSNVRMIPVQHALEFTKETKESNDVLVEIDEPLIRPATPTLDLEPPYHIFSHGEKWCVVAIIGAAGLFSGLSSNIYFPSQSAIAADLGVSLKTISLTIVSYLAAQALTPLIWGSLSDTIGRRQIYIYSFLVYIAANIGLSFTPNIAVLVTFRALQAAGSASTVSIGNGVIQDITPPSESGGFLSFYQAIRNFSVAVGPVIGGVLANYLGFRSIFVFLLIMSSITLTVLVIFLPETLRSIAGNGTLRLHGIHQPLIRTITKNPEYIKERNTPYRAPKITYKVFLQPLRLLKEKDIVLSLIFGGVIYAIWSMMSASTTGLFKEIFGLNETMIGLAYLPNGLGTICGSMTIGNLMNRSFKQEEKVYRREHALPSTYQLSAKSLPTDFPIVRARLAYAKYIVPIFICCTCLYGYSLASPSLTSKRGWIAVPLVLQFIVAASSSAILATNITLVSDLCPGKGASSTATNNLVRCLMGAVGNVGIEHMILTIGVGSTFLVLSLIAVCATPLLWVEWTWGARWRSQRLKEKALMEEVIGLSELQ